MEAFRNLLDKQLRRALGNLRSAQEAPAMELMYVQACPDTAEFSILNEESKVLVKLNIHRWSPIADNSSSEAEIRMVRQIMTELLARAQEKGQFDGAAFGRPFQVLLVNDEFRQIAELLSIESEETTLSDNLLEDFNRELNKFYKKLMSDV